MNKGRRKLKPPALIVINLLIDLHKHFFTGWQDFCSDTTCNEPFWGSFVYLSFPLFVSFLPYFFLIFVIPLLIVQSGWSCRFTIRIMISWSMVSKTFVSLFCIPSWWMCFGQHHTIISCPVVPLYFLCALISALW